MKEIWDLLFDPTLSYAWFQLDVEFAQGLGLDVIDLNSWYSQLHLALTLTDINISISLYVLFWLCPCINLISFQVVLSPSFSPHYLSIPFLRRHSQMQPLAPDRESTDINISLYVLFFTMFLY